MLVGLPKVSVDEEYLPLRIGKCDSQVCGRTCFALPGTDGGDHNGFELGIRCGEEKVYSKATVGLPHCLVVALIRCARLTASRNMTESGNDSQARNTKALTHVLSVLEPLIEELQKIGGSC